MTPKSPYFRFACLIVIVSHLSACAAVILPERVKETQEIYPIEPFLSGAAPFSSSGFKSNTYEAPYDTVFRTSRIAILDNYYKIVLKDQKRGIILAEKDYRLKKGNPRVPMGKYYLGVRIKELGPERTQIDMYPASQATCSHASLGFTIGISLLIFTIPTVWPLYYIEKSDCEETATPRQGSEAANKGNLLTIFSSIERKLLKGGDI